MRQMYCRLFRVVYCVMDQKGSPSYQLDTIRQEHDCSPCVTLVGLCAQRQAHLVTKLSH